MAIYVSGPFEFIAKNARSRGRGSSVPGVFLAGPLNICLNAPNPRRADLPIVAQLTAENSAFRLQIARRNPAVEAEQAGVGKRKAGKERSINVTCGLSQL